MIFPCYKDAETCTRCHGRVDPKKAVWLELNNKTNLYCEPGTVPERDSQGGFAFGEDCARVVRGNPTGWAYTGRAIKDRGLNHTPFKKDKIMKGLLTVLLFVVIQGCASMRPASNPCYVPTDQDAKASRAAMITELAECSVASLTVSQHVACMHLKGYTLDYCDGVTNQPETVALQKRLQTPQAPAAGKVYPSLPKAANAQRLADL